MLTAYSLWFHEPAYSVLPITSGEVSKAPPRNVQMSFPVRAAIAVIIPGWLRG